MVDERYFLIIVGGAIAVGLQPNGLACASAGGLPGAGRFADGRLPTERLSSAVLQQIRSVQPDRR
ncbi:hypothetical protein A1507_12435 [Methylomonas koyamae]|uniref:Uncharacterized protein n=1 Tax=Methylomonas koyamae TaxID=702114 RepID=A0A177NG39_9GAMM|nr:hypothetical protein A1507_12435 [Methylomonas koyamae]